MHVMARLVDLSSWTTLALARAYVGYLMATHPLDQEQRAEMALVQAEWQRRPTADRQAALRDHKASLGQRLPG